jgi:hypothetical protein
VQHPGEVVFIPGGCWGRQLSDRTCCGCMLVAMSSCTFLHRSCQPYTHVCIMCACRHCWLHLPAVRSGFSAAVSVADQTYIPVSYVACVYTHVCRWLVALCAQP